MTTFIADLILGRRDRPGLSAVTRLLTWLRPEAARTSGSTDPPAHHGPDPGIETGPRLMRRGPARPAAGGGRTVG